MEHCKKKVLVVYNPVSGAGKGKKIAQELLKYLKTKELDIFVIESNNKKNLQESMKNIDQDYELIFVCGGDGTFRDVMETMNKCDWHTPLALIPAGSGNDFIKSLEIKGEMQVLVDKYLNSKEKKVYNAFCNDLYLINIFGIGIDTEIVKKSVIIKKYIKGGLSYALATLATLLTYKPKKYQIKLDDKEIEKEIYIMVVCNGKYFGGGMKIAPNADVNLEELEVVILNKVSKIQLLKAFFRIYKGTHIDLPYVESYKCKKVEIECLSGKESINVDGDLFCEKNIIIKKDKPAKIRLKGF